MAYRATSRFAMRRAGSRCCCNSICSTQDESCCGGAARTTLRGVGDVGILGIGTGTALVIGAIGVFAYLQLFKKR